MTNLQPSGVSRSASSRGSAAGTLNTDTSHGTTTIDDSVVTKIAGIAAREVPGVHDLGGGAARAIGAIRNRLNAADQGQGVSAEVGEKQAAIDVTVVAEYPVDLKRVAEEIRSAVIDAVQDLVGLQVTEVNVTIADVHIPDDDDAEAPRVQ